MIWLAVLLALLALVLLAYGLFEAGWLRTRVLEVEIDGLPAVLDGLRIAHLSDFHLGAPSRGRVATERAVAWVAERRARSRLHHGRPRLASARPAPPAAAARHARPPLRRARQPRCRGHARSVLAGSGARRPRGSGRVAAGRGGRRRASRRRVGSRSSAPTPRATRSGLPGRGSSSTRPQGCGSCSCHFPGIDRKLPDGASTSSWPGISTPVRSRSLRRADGSRSPILAGASSPGCTRRPEECCMSRQARGRRSCRSGFFARPEVTELVLRAAKPRLQQSA